MPEIYNEKATRASVTHLVAEYGLPSSPVGSFDIPDQQPRPEESFFHPVKALDDLIQAINKNTEVLSLVLKDMQRERIFADRTVLIGATVAYAVDYLEHKYVYILSSSAITLTLSSGGTLALTANKWQQLALPRGTLVTVQGGSDATPNAVTVRACDVYLG